MQSSAANSWERISPAAAAACDCASVGAGGAGGAAGVVAFGVTIGEAEGVGSAKRGALLESFDPEVEGAGVTTVLADGAGAGAGASTGPPVAKTWRKRNSAVWPTSSTTRSPDSPGTEIKIWRLVPLPWATTSLSATPSELTRWRIMLTA